MGSKIKISIFEISIRLPFNSSPRLRDAPQDFKGAYRRPPKDSRRLRSPGILGRRPSIRHKKTHKGMAHKGIFPGSRIVQKANQNPSEMSRGRWPCGREPPVKRQTPLLEKIPLYLCFLGPDSKRCAKTAAKVIRHAVSANTRGTKSRSHTDVYALEAKRPQKHTPLREFVPPSVPKKHTPSLFVVLFAPPAHPPSLLVSSFWPSKAPPVTVLSLRGDQACTRSPIVAHGHCL